MDMDILVRKKPFREENQGGFVNDVDSDDEGAKERGNFHSECLGGAGEDDADELEETEGDLTVRRQALCRLSLDECKAMLRRDKELQRANAPGRPKEADKQMKAYAHTFGSMMRLSPPTIPTQRRSHLAVSLPFHAAANFQRAVAKEMRTQEPGNRTSTPDTAELSIEHLPELQCRNEAKDEAVCVNIPLADVLQGPGHVAWKLIQDIKNDPSNNFEFNEEQILVIALLIWPLEQAWRVHVKSQQAQRATVDTLRNLPNDLGLPRVVIIGGGGCGKTTVNLAAIGPI